MHPQAKGFSLVELMVAMVAGMVVVGAVLAFTISSLRNNSEFVQATRLTQELRNNMDFVTRELRRAGYDDGALTYAIQGTTGTATSDFSPMLAMTDRDGNGTADDGCLIYAYDRATGESGRVNLSNGEIRGIRLVRQTVAGVTNVGIIEMAESSAGVTPACGDAAATYTTYPATCNGAWCPVSDPRIINITAFTVSTNHLNVAATPTTTPMQIRDISLVLTGRLVGNADVSRSLSSRVKVRSDCMKATTACNAAPAMTGTN